MKKLLLAIAATTLTLGVLVSLPHSAQVPPAAQPIQIPRTPSRPAIAVQVPGHKDYAGCVAQLREWEKQAADLAEVGVYGKSSRGVDLYYLKATNRYSAGPKPVVLIHGCIHGNEPWATGEVMAWLGTMLGTYGEDKQATDLLDSCEIYFVPVLSPDSYPNSRTVDGVDPNRNFPCPAQPNVRSVPPVRAIQELATRIKPKVVISAHTFGRVFLSPWGDQNQLCPNAADYDRIFGKMCQLSGYEKKRACQVYGMPIFGGELDWYYRQGAFSMVVEVGTHQVPPSLAEIQGEFQRTYKAILLFVEDGLKVNVRRL